MNKPFQTDRRTRTLGVLSSICTTILVFVSVASLSNPQIAANSQQIAHTPTPAVVA